MNDLREAGRREDLNRLISTRGTLVSRVPFTAEETARQDQEEKAGDIEIDLDPDVKREKTEELDEFTNKAAIVPI